MDVKLTEGCTVPRTNNYFKTMSNNCLCIDHLFVIYIFIETYSAWFLFCTYKIKLFK